MKWTRIGVLAIMAMLVASIVPFALAEDDDSTPAVNVSAGAATVQVGNGVHAQVGNVLRDVRERVLGLRNAQLHVKSDVASARLKVNEARQSMLKDKDELATTCRGAGETDACKEMRVKVKLGAQETLLTSADLIIGTLEGIKTRADASSLNADVIAQIDADVDAQIAKVQAARDALANFDENSDKATIKAATTELQNAWKDARVSIKVNAGRLGLGELTAVTDSVTRLSEKLVTVIDQMQAKGADVTAVTTLKTQFDSELADAKTHIANAEAVYTGATADNLADKEKSVVTEMQAARASLKEAHSTLKQIAQDLRNSIKDQRQDAKPAKDKRPGKNNGSATE